METLKSIRRSAPNESGLDTVALAILTSAISVRPRVAL
jgi:hypothetical protein